MFKEMHAFAERESWVSARRIVRMATVNGARALGRAGQLGVIKAGSQADLVALPFKGKLGNVHNAVVEHEGDVAASLIDGQWAKSPL
jgi:cytosine/adenosine deaminase-related metal-dependent hydrolase